MQSAAGADKILPDLRTLKGGGAPCPPELFSTVADVLGVVLAHDYGMTEVPMIGVADPCEASDVLAQTDGRIVPGNEIRIVSSSGAAQTEGVVGEVQVFGRGVCLGYTDEVETRAAFTDDGWFRTGDLGRVTAGLIEVVGRLKDVIIRKGENIVAQELEQLLLTHPSVAEVAVVGLPDADRGELVCAVVVPTPGATPPTTEDLATHLVAAGVMRQKFPERVVILTELPRRGLAKVDKTAIRSAITGPTDDQPAPART